MALLPEIVASFSTTITARIDASATTIAIDKVVDDHGESLDGKVLGLLLNRGTSDEEFIIGTMDAAGAQLTGVTRALSLIDGVSVVAGKAFPHGRKTTIECTDHPYVARIISLLNGTTGYDATAIPFYASAPSFSSASQQFASVKFVEDTANAGAADASEVQKGIIEMATAAEAAAGTATGTTGAALGITPTVLAAQIQSAAWISGITGGTADAITLTLTPTLTEYTEGQTFKVKFTQANTGAASFDIDSLGVKAIKKYVEGVKVDLEDNDIVVDFTGILLYDGTDFVLVGMGANANSLADIAAAIAYVEAQPTPQTFTAGEGLAANDIVKLADYDGAGDKMYKLRGALANLTLTLTADNRSIVYLDDTTVLVFYTTTASTAITVKAYTIDSSGALALVDTLVISGMWATGGSVEMESLRNSATTAVIVNGESSSVVTLSGGTLSSGALSSADLGATSNGRAFSVTEDVFVTFSRSGSAVTFSSHTISGDTITFNVDSESVGGFGTGSDLAVDQIDGDPNTFFILCRDNNPNPDAVLSAVVGCTGVAVTSKGTTASLYTANDALPSIASYNNGTDTLVYLLKGNALEALLAEYVLSGTVVTLRRTSEDLLGPDGTRVVAATPIVRGHANSLFVYDDSDPMYLIDLDNFEVYAEPTDWSLANVNKVTKSTDGHTILLYDDVSDLYFISDLDWLGAFGMVNAAVLEADSLTVVQSFSGIDSLTSQIPRRTYYLDRAGVASLDITPFPIYKTIDATSAIIDDIR